MFQRVVASFFEAIDALVFPWQCSICDAGRGRRAVLWGLPPRAPRGGGGGLPALRLPIGPWSRGDGGCSRCRGKSLGFDAAIALGPYQGPIRHLCLRLKDERNAWLARWLIDLLLEARTELAGLPRDALVVPVPLHWTRRWRRGYNQSDELARRLSKRLALRRFGAAAHGRHRSAGGSGPGRAGEGHARCLQGPARVRIAPWRGGR